MSGSLIGYARCSTDQQDLTAVRTGDTLVVPKLDRLARSVPDARAIGDDLATFAEFDVDLRRRMHASSDYSITDLAELFSVSRPTVYRRLRAATPSAK